MDLSNYCEIFYQWLIEEELISEEELTLEDLTNDIEDMVNEAILDDLEESQQDKEDLHSVSLKSSNSDMYNK